MGPLWPSVCVLAALVSAEPGPTYSLANVVLYPVPVPVAPVPAVPFLQLVPVAEDQARLGVTPRAGAVSVSVTSRAGLVGAASVADNVVGVTVAKQHKPGCPYCDSSVFPYCSDKLLHDACCCLNPYDTSLPPQCQLADCSFLHANSCKEHRLITRCCCDRLLYIKR